MKNKLWRSVLTIVTALFIIQVTVACPEEKGPETLGLLALLGLGNGGGGTTEPGTVVTPVFSPTAGTYGSDQSVTIASSTDGASIFYTTDGTAPATSVTGSTLQYSNAIEVTGNGTSMDIQAIAVKSGMTDSAVATALYIINYDQVSTPQFSPAAGTFTSDQSVTITSSTDGTSIFYTTDGTDPATSAGGSTLAYSAAIPVTGNGTIKTIKAIAIKNGLINSTVSTGLFTINYAQVSTPQFSPVAGTFNSDQRVTITSSTDGASIFYTTDGTTPATSVTGSTQQYSSNIAITGNGTIINIQAIAVKSGFNNSTFATALYTINYDQVSTPQISPAAGTYSSIQNVTITTSTSGATIFYTTDGTTPANSISGSTLQYSSAIAVTTPKTIKAIAVKSAMADSSVASAVFTVNIAGAKTTYTVNSVSFKMAYIPPKTFFTGLDDAVSSSVSAAYEIGETEVTYELWNTVRTWAVSHGYTFANAGVMGDGTGDTNQHPVTTISWRDAMVWSNALTEYYNAQNGTTYACVYTSDEAYTTPIRDSSDGAYGGTVNTTAGSFDYPYVNPDAKGFRLPTMDEWDLVARYIKDSNADGDIKDAGEFYHGNYASGADDMYSVTTGGSDYDADGDIEYTNDISWNSGNSGSSTHAVKTKSANALGLYDLGGNVWEWNYGWHPSIPEARVSRGGCWFLDPDSMQIGMLETLFTYYEGIYVGFRPSRTL